MSGSVDSRIATIKFDNKQFESGARTSMNTLGKLKSAITGLPSKGLGGLSNVASKFSLGSMKSEVDSVKAHFSAMSAVGLAALATITTRAVSAGLDLVKSLSLAPIMDGFHEYETNMNSIQTVLANTKDQGTNLHDVNAALAELNTYADKTIYNFSEMAKNIGTFTAAGVDLKTSVASIKGIANLAAISGSNSEQASTAMYQLSQAISSGKVGLQDWNSVVNAGMGGSVFQKALARTAATMGTVGKTAVKVDKQTGKLTISGQSFRESITAKPGQKSWLTSDVLTNTLKQFGGDMTNAQLKAQGFTDAQVKAIQQMGKMGQDAATKVKTMTQLMDTLKEGVGSGWAKTFQLVFGNFEEAKKTFTATSNVLGGFVSASANARNKLIGDWKKLGGRTVLIQAISNAFKALVAFIKPIHNAFRDIFPKTTGKQLYDMTVTLRDFTKNLMIGGGTAKNVRKTFRGVFAIFDIAVQILKGVIRYFASFIGLLLGGRGSILTFTGSLGDLLVQFDEWLKKGDKIGAMFDHVINGRAALLKPIIAFVGKLVEAFAALISGGTDAFVDKLWVAFDSLGPVVDAFRNAINGAVDAIETRFKATGPIIDGVHTKVVTMVSNIKRTVSGFANSIGFGDLFDMKDTVSDAQAGISGVGSALGATVGVAEKIKNSWGSVVAVFKRVGQFLAPIWSSIQEIFSGFKDRLTGYVKNLGFDEGLSLVNTGFFIAFYVMLRKFIKGMSGLIDSAKGTFDSISEVLEQTTKNLKTMQADVRADILIKIAGALALLSVALLVLSRIDPKKLGVALAAVAVMLGELVGALKLLEKGASLTGSVQVTILAVALVALSVALLAMAAAIAILGNMKLKTILKGLGAVTAILAVVVAAAAVLSATGGAPSILVASAAILVLGIALTAFAGALKLYSQIDVKTMLNGGLKIAAALAAIALTMSLMPPNMLVSAAALIIVSQALVILAAAMKLISMISGGDIVKSLVTIGAALIILAGGLYLMTGALPGAAALAVASASLIILAVALKALGSLDIKTIMIALGAIAGTFAVLGLAALLLTPVVPVLYALAGAIALLGVAALAVGGGVLMLSAGLAALAASGAAGVAVLTASVVGIASIIPLVMHQFGLGVIAFASVIARSGPPLVKAFTTVFLAMIHSLRQITPQLGSLLITMLNTGMRVIRSVAPNYVQTGITILLAFLRGIRNNIGKIADTATSIVTKFLAALSRDLPKLIQAGFNFIINFINGIARAINKNAPRIRAAGKNLGVAIVNGMLGGLASGIPSIMKAAGNLAKGALNSAMGILGIHSPSREFAKVGMYSSQGLAQGLTDYASTVSDAGSGVAQTALDVITATMAKIPDAVATNADMSPVITPVLDLTQLQNDATKIGASMPTTSVVADVSYGRASNIARAQEAAAAASATAAAAPSGEAKIEFNQYNTSPKALSPVEIYRNTKSQISLAKEALKANAAH